MGGGGQCSRCHGFCRQIPGCPLSLSQSLAAHLDFASLHMDTLAMYMLKTFFPEVFHCTSITRYQTKRPTLLPSPFAFNYLGTCTTTDTNVSLPCFLLRRPRNPTHIQLPTAHMVRALSRMKTRTCSNQLSNSKNKKKETSQPRVTENTCIVGSKPGRARFSL